MACPSVFGETPADTLFVRPTPSDANSAQPASDGIGRTAHVYIYDKNNS